MNPSAKGSRRKANSGKGKLDRIRACARVARDRKDRASATRPVAGAALHSQAQGLLLLLCVYSLRCRTSELRPLGDQPRKDCMHRADNASGHMAQAQD